MDTHLYCKRTHKYMYKNIFDLNILLCKRKKNSQEYVAGCISNFDPRYGILSPSQPAPTILVLKTWVDLWPWKKNQVQNMDLKKAGCKKQGHCYSKRKEAIAPCFLQPIFWTWFFFQGHKLTHLFKTRIVGADWLVDYRTPAKSAMFWIYPHSLT